MSEATIKYDIQGKSSIEVVTLQFGSNDQDTSSWAVIAKALLQLGKQDWELQSVSYNEQRDRSDTGVVYHLKRQVTFTTKG